MKKKEKLIVFILIIILLLIDQITKIIAIKQGWMIRKTDTNGNGQYILTKGMKKYLKQCESCDYKFTYKEMILGLVNLGIVLFLCVIVSYRILMLMI